MPKRPNDAKKGDPLDRIRELAALLDEYRLSAVSADWGAVRIRLERSPAPPAAAPTLAAAPAAAAAAPAKSEGAETAAPGHVTIEAPMVGTFYRATAPGADPYVREGDVIKEGQILCIIEAMKLMNEIEAKVGGRIVKVLVENGVAVEYGQPLFLVEPLH
jgi:acetyl-CoA carboxylase biotin carboxyl carrier protein